ncbi:uncharacterized protein LOC121251464 [Juglans microcarpa x Juglans regia]|uniref:uncharacterized protein LOC121251464 n=1 Tax=Juglans microcarpa x Juglans regia TaxID=2249226 RepID=UPI001B7F337C|nr:uncharacterized protein LOC121251464 [Juglans microcarpa x Juglans regia]
MKFFRSCYRPGGTPAPSQEEEDNTKTMSRTVPSSSSRRRRLTTAGRSKTASAKNWRPALSMISEDKAVDESGRGRWVSEKQSYVSCKSRSISSAKSPCLTHSNDESRDNSMSMIFLAISPTPFMF